MLHRKTFSLIALALNAAALLILLAMIADARHKAAGLSVRADRAEALAQAGARLAARADAKCSALTAPIPALPQAREFTL